jgi:hypothetical protein
MHGLWDAEEKGAFKFEVQHAGIKAALMDGRLRVGLVSISLQG